MANDIASLGIKVTTDGVQQASAQLDALDASGQRAAASTDNINKSFSQGASSGSARTIAENYKAQGAALASLVGQIDPTIAKLEALDQQQAKLSAFKKSGVLSADDFATYSAAIEKSRASLSGVSDEVKKFSVNSRTAYSASALFTDALTGQFGRAQREVAALANETGLMSRIFTLSALPILAVVGAIAAFAVAALKGSEEAEAYNKALLLTGNYAGQTADSLGTMAKSFATYGTTQHEAAAALAEVAQSGKFTATQIGLVGQAALNMSKITGQSTQETIKQFSELQDAPLKAIMALDSAQHFLTTTIYEQIKALEDQGHAQDAADLASQTYAQHIADVATKSQQNLGLIEQSWNGIKNATKEAIDAVMGFGRAQEGADKFNAISNKRNALLDVQKQGAQLTEGSDGKVIPIQQQIDAYTKQLGELQDAEVTVQKAANKQSIASQSTLALEKSDAEASIYDTREQKRAKETLAAYNKANDGIEKATAAGDTATAERIAQNYVKINEGIAEKYKDKIAKVRKTGTKADPLSQLDSLTDKAITAESAGATASDPQAALLKEQVTQLQAISKAAAEAIAKGASLAAVQDKVSIATAAVNAHFKDESDQLILKNTEAVARYKASLDDMLATRKQQIELQVEAIGQGAKETQQQQQLIALQTDYNKKRAALVKQEQDTTSALSKDGYKQQIADLDSYYSDSVSATKDGWKQMNAAQANGVNGMNASIKDFIDDQSNIAKETKSFTTSFINGFGSAFTSFATGTESAKKAFGSFIDSMYQQSVAFLAKQAIKSLFQSFTSPSNGGTGGGFSTLLGNFFGSGGGGGGTGSGTPFTGFGAVGSDGGGSTSIFDSVNMGGGLAVGGPVDPGSFHPVNENGPELYVEGGKTYLMGGATPGRVVPLTSGGAGGTVVNQTIVVSGMANRQTQDQMFQRAAQKQRVATSRNG